MKIEMLKPYGLATPGMIINPAPGVALLLIQRGVAKLVEDDRPLGWNKMQTEPPPPAKQIPKKRKGGCRV
jgi:hypothetical protein